MSSVDYLREFVNERLTAAAEEIFGAFKRTIVEYEEELSRQRRLLENAWKPETKLNNKELPQQLSVRKTGPKPHLNTERELPQQHDFQEKEVLPDQQELCAQERNSNLDQEDPEPPRIKEEQEDLCSSQEGEQLVLKEETDTFIFTPSFEESDHSEDQTLYLSRDTTLSVAEKESLVNIQVINSLVSEPKTEHQFLSHNSYSPESQNLTEGMYEDSGSTIHTDTEPEPQRRHYSSRSHTDDVNNPNLLEIQQNTHTGKRSYICDTCGKDFKFQSVLQRHVSVHTDEQNNFLIKIRCKQ
ncbi:zinc finger protein 836-like [Plectropomus leopardus]|uniref:zinc finger protein 836-like n=1 Tax=Plectropomus leopardus TaxID=160734 RepID=UPI001C4D3D2E|nr:zinc finger protein 836-like [Plectropomus leopardus]